jgi:outer membrane protein assembly factor BamB
VLIDRLIVGQDYRPTELASGQYYWRVAPSQYETGRFMPASTFRIPTPTANTERATAPTFSGWTAAIGPVTQAFRSKVGSSDIVAVHANGGVYALDPERGVAHWVERPAPGSNPPRSLITPVSIRTGSRELIALAFGSEVLAVDARTGQRMWTVLLAGGAVTTSLVSDETATLYVITSSRELLLFDPLKGAITKRIKLERPPIFSPLAISGKGLILPLAWRTLEIRTREGEFVRSIELTSEITTSPILVNSLRGAFVVIGTKRGLMIFDTDTFTSLGIVTIADGDDVISSLVASDVSGDSGLEVIASTKNRRLAVINLVSQKVLWSKYAPGASTPVFYDIDSNGKLDLLTTEEGSLVGLAGSNGSTVWRNEEVVSDKFGTPVLAVRNREGHLLLITRDKSGVGLRALEIRNNSTQKVSR